MSGIHLQRKIIWISSCTVIELRKRVQTDTNGGHPRFPGNFCVSRGCDARASHLFVSHHSHRNKMSFGRRTDHHPRPNKDPHLLPSGMPALSRGSSAATPPDHEETRPIRPLKGVAAQWTDLRITGCRWHKFSAGRMKRFNGADGSYEPENREFSTSCGSPLMASGF
jgi:hypothetical protein